MCIRKVLVSISRLPHMRPSRSKKAVKKVVVVNDDSSDGLDSEDNEATQASRSLRSQLGASMAGARRTILALLKPHRLNHRFKSDILCQLMKHQPAPMRVRPDDIRQFVRARRPPHNNICLFAVLDNERVADVSWLRSVRNLYGRHNRGTEDARKVISAFRNEAYHAPKMREARALYTVGQCADCRRRRKLAVDHSGMCFAQILDDFIRAERHKSESSIRYVEAMGDIPLAWNRGAYVLSDRALSFAWRAWHDERAHLVGLCRRCNSAKGSGGYHYTSFGIAETTARS